VLVLDLALRHVHGVAATGVLDEPAHLSTAGLALLACRPWNWLSRHRAESAVVLAASVLIDLDHVPLYAGVPHIASGGRPYSHSLTTVALLLVVALALPAGRRRWPAAGATGVALHLVRDLATGPGVTLFWPISSADVLVPYWVYAVVCVGLAAAATVRMRRRSLPVRQ
jgi:inner membrane protein